MGVDHCPYCGHLCDNSLNIDAKAPIPIAGDVSLCGGCGELMEYGADMRLLKVTEIALSELTPEQLYNLNEISIIIKRNGENKPH